MEVCHVNVWGAVCDRSEWGIADAQVACRQLGLPTSGAMTLTEPAVPNDNQFSWLNYVRCRGTESSLFNCNIQPSGVKCYSNRYGGVSCQEGKS